LFFFPLSLVQNDTINGIKSIKVSSNFLLIFALILNKISGISVHIFYLGMRKTLLECTKIGVHGSIMSKLCAVHDVDEKRMRNGYAVL